MARTFLRQDTQIRKSDLFDGTLTPGSTLESGSTSIEGDLNSLRSQVYNLMKKQTGGAWYDDIATPANFPSDTPAPSKRAVDNLNTDLRDMERKRVLVTDQSTMVTDVTVLGLTAATGTLTTTGAISDGETVTIGAQTYTFTSPFVNSANNIDASGTTAQTLENLRRAINGDGVAGTNYGTGTATNASVTAVESPTTVVLTAITPGSGGNSIATTELMANASFGGATLSGGTNGNNFVVLSAPQLPSNTTAAIGNVTTLGTVAAYNAGFGAHSLASVAGSSPLIPKNLAEIYDSVSHDPILSSGRQIYALFQTESNTDGSTMSGTTPNRAQLSFVRLTALGSSLEAVPFADIAGKTVHYAPVGRKALEDLNEQDFLRGASMDTPAGSATSRQGAYDAQGVTPVEVTTNSILDLNSAGIYWELRDLLNATLFRLTEGSTGGTTTLQVGADVDTFDVNAVVNDFAEGLRIDTAGNRIDIGVNAGVIESKSAQDLTVYSDKDLFLDDSYQTGSSWVGTGGIKLSAATAEWTTFKTNYGEVSLLNAINQAKNPAAQRGVKVYANCTLLTNADTDVGGTSGGTNLDAQLPNMTGGSFLTDYDVFLNGNLLRPGSNSSDNHDYYPGTSLALGQLKFEFKIKVNDVLCVIPYA